ncbi:YciI family protein [Nocardia jejuensis]|uniref:YciI family protein n=1 Tax=Nocardia jejuensis TaxID=328049 RepID=UPI00083190EA|nr:YciI family protein [Nocardia jejuensis]
MPIFAVHYTYSTTTAEDRLANRPEHRGFLNNLVDEGVVLTSGPYPDGSGALILVRAEGDVETVGKLFDEDPFAKLGYVEGRRIVEWVPVMGAFAEES